MSISPSKIIALAVALLPAVVAVQADAKRVGNGQDPQGTGLNGRSLNDSKASSGATVTEIVLPDGSRYTVR